MTTPQLTLYNTLTRTKEAFTPLDASNVRMYVCGPTVYDFAHIGNARPVIVFDVLFRLLRHVYGAEHVTYVRNITDVDDKINARALRDFPDLPLNEAIRKVTEKTETQFLSDAERLGNLPPTYQPRATDNIAEMQVLIGNLIQRGHAYEANGEVLFSVQSMPDYGQLSGRNLEDNLAGARIAVDAHKRNPADFVLWKQSSVDEPGWDSPWGRGRPGWHIECSAMSERYLWDEVQDKLSPEAHKHPHAFDIHGGGLDLIFPHHENEIAQSRCAHGTHAMANIWMHNGFLQVEGQKMSKSLGNFYTISQLLDSEEFGGRKWPGEVLRLAMLMTHYREPIDFSVKRLEEALSLLTKWSRRVLPPQAEAAPPLEFLAALTDDLDISTALRLLAQYDDAAALTGALRMLGINAAQQAGDDVTVHVTGVSAGAMVGSASIKFAVDARLAALNAKDFAKADAIRNELAEQGIALMDYKDENGERQTKWEVKR
jgi:cysteinyl-tRNA synthetase